MRREHYRHVAANLIFGNQSDAPRTVCCSSGPEEQGRSHFQIISFNRSLFQYSEPELRTAEVWIALRFMGFPVTVNEALVIERLLQAVRGAAFAIPGAFGAQEAGLILLCGLFEIPPDQALALSLVKRPPISWSACQGWSHCRSWKVDVLRHSIPTPGKAAPAIVPSLSRNATPAYR